MAKLKKLLNWLLVQRNKISPQYFFQAYATPIMINEQVIMTLYDLKLKAHGQEKEEVYCRWSMYGTYERPTKTHYSYLVWNSAPYITHYDIISDHIRVNQWAYKASPNAYLNASICLLYYQSYPTFRNVQDLPPEMIRINQRIIAYIACFSLHSFFDAYKSQVQKTMFDQYLRKNCYCVMTQLSKTLCYCREISKDIISFLHPMPNF